MVVVVLVVVVLLVGGVKTADTPGGAPVAGASGITRRLGICTRPTTFVCSPALRCNLESSVCYYGGKCMRQNTNNMHMRAHAHTELEILCELLAVSALVTNMQTRPYARSAHKVF